MAFNLVKDKSGVPGKMMSVETGGQPPPLLKDSPAEQQQPGQNSNTQPIGTGFVNIGRYLAANQGIGQDVTNRGNALLGNERQRIGGALGTANRTATATGARAPESIDASGVMTKLEGGASEDDLKKYVAPWENAADAKQIDFSGKDARSLDTLADTRTTGRALNNASTLGGYTPNIEAIDRALYGSVGKSAAEGVGRSTELQRLWAGSGIDTANKNIHDANAAGTARVEGNRKAFGEAAKGIIGTAQERANAANAMEQYNLAHPLSYAPGSGIQTTWNAGSGPAQANQFLTGAQSGQLASISKLLGDPSLAVQSGPAYQAGGYSYTNTNPRNVYDPTQTAEARATNQESQMGRVMRVQQQLDDIMRNPFANKATAISDLAAANKDLVFGRGGKVHPGAGSKK